MTKKQIEILNECIDSLMVDGKNTKYDVAKRLNELIKSDILEEDLK